MNKKIPYVIIGYGLFLIVIGVLGYLSNPEKAKTALVSGGTFGGLSIVWGILAARGIRWAPVAALVTAIFLIGIFTWRASAGWIAYAQGESEKLVAAVLISLMWTGSAVLIGVLLSRRRRPSCCAA
jgi:uncharacterized membrane protein (UPF0136 family)